MRLGLRARMAASYVLVTFATVIVVEALAAIIVIPNVNEEADLTSRVVNTASQYARDYGAALGKAANAFASGRPLTIVKASSQSTTTPGLTMDQLAIDLLDGVRLGEDGLRLRPGEVRLSDTGVRIPRQESALAGSRPASELLILSTRGVVYATSYPGRFATGSSAVRALAEGWNLGGSGVTKVADGKVAWASQPVMAPSDGITPAPAPKQPILGFVYVQVPVPAGGLPNLASLRPLVEAGAIFLLVSVPVGALFGLLTTRGTIRRLRRLAAGTVGFAAGDFSRRVPESGPDEVGQLERHFNGMAQRLSASIAEQRALAERNARLAERSRISRELHDSISQDLFSMSALVGGLRKALPAEAAVQPQLETLHQMVGSTIREMRALLLELRPTELEEKGLLPALADLWAERVRELGGRLTIDSGRGRGTALRVLLPAGGGGS